MVGRKCRTGSQPRRAGPPSPLDLTRTPVHVFDLSGDSVEFPQAPAPEDVEGWTGLLFRTMEAARAEVGVGRYDEVRAVVHVRYVPGTRGRSAGVENGPPGHRSLPRGRITGSGALRRRGPLGGQQHRESRLWAHCDPGTQAAVEMGGALRFWTLYGHLAMEATSSSTPGNRFRKERPSHASAPPRQRQLGSPPPFPGHHRSAGDGGQLPGGGPPLPEEAVEVPFPGSEPHPASP